MMSRMHAFCAVNFIFLVFLITRTLCARSEFSKPNGTDRNLPDLITLVESWGYPIESHSVTTSDDYHLTIFRIPNRQSLKSPVFIQHGLVSCGAVFLANKRGLAYSLYEDGYDIWVGNARGSQFSRSHSFYTTKNRRFWNFSFHEMGVYDLPAVLSYITNLSGKSKVHYIGHSMGTTMFLVMASKLPEQLERIDTVSLLAPVALPKHMSMVSSSVRWKLIHFVTATLPKIGYPRHKRQRWLAELVYHKCERSSLIGRLCRSMTGIQQSPDPSSELYNSKSLKRLYSQESNLNDEPDVLSENANVFDQSSPSRLESSRFNKCESKSLLGWLCRMTSKKENDADPSSNTNLLSESKNSMSENYEIFDETDESDKDESSNVKLKANLFDRAHADSVIPYLYDGTSWKVHLHFLQIIKAERFQEFDYRSRNRIEYQGREKPLEYPIWTIKKRIYLLSGGLDTTANYQDVLWLAQHLTGADVWLIEGGLEDFDHDAFNFGLGIGILETTLRNILVASETGEDPDLTRTAIPEEPKSSDESGRVRSGVTTPSK